MSVAEPPVDAPQSPPATPVVEPPGVAEVVAASPVRAVSARPDAISFNKNGKIEMTIAGEKYTLRCPNVSEMEVHREALNELLAKQAEKQEKKESLGYDPVWDIRDLVVGVINMLADHQYAVPEADTPPWLTNGGLPHRIINHWRTIPEGD